MYDIIFTLFTSLASQPYFFPRANGKNGGKRENAVFPFSIFRFPPFYSVRSREKYGWLARLIVYRVPPLIFAVFEYKMARRRAIPGEHVRQALQGAPQLLSFIIPNVRPTGRQLGGGSYGTVEELEIDGLVCAGKKLYDALIDPENQGAQRMVDKYYNECRLLSDLRHPHIVQFLGICFLPDSRLPVLVMERLQGSLDELLENTADIPLSTKVSILQDVARGLVYLHHHSPSVIHRDLSARNVLLNSAMTAKIADLGNSRIADIPPDQLAQTMTRGIPGTLVYMPPEVSDEDHKYGPSLDMFSFGHLSLFVAIQVFPQNLLKPTYRDPRTKQLKARSELERREQYIDTLHQKFVQRHPLVVLIKGCLEYEPVDRPTARQALERLGEMRARVRDPYSDLNRLQLEKSLTEKEAEIQQIPQLRSELEQLTVSYMGRGGWTGEGYWQMCGWVSRQQMGE